MSWLGRSIANSLLVADDTHYGVVPYAESTKTPPQQINQLNESIKTPPEFDSINRPNDVVSDDEYEKEQGETQEEIDNNYDYDGDDCDGDNEGRGVKEDLSEFTETLTRQFWGVASFLAPPPPPPPPPPSIGMKCDANLVNRSLIEEVEEEELGRSYDNGDDFDDGKLPNRSLMKEAVIEEDLGRSYCNGDDFDDGKLLKGSVPKEGVVEEVEEEGLRRFYDNGDDFDEEEEVEDAVGVTEALAFAHNIAHHPETWLDFPVEEEEEGFEDFQISDLQYKHALAIQRCVPTLAALRIELCPVHMSEGYFWMVYFVLLHSRLCKGDADQLSSAELVQARSAWREELKKRAKPETDWFGRSTFYLQESTLSPREDCDPELLEDSDTRHLTFNTYYAGSRTQHATTYNETEKQLVECDEARSADTPSGNSERELLTFQSAQIIKDDSEDDWLQDTADLDGYSTTGIVVNEEDVSFSDLEEDSDWTVPVRSK